MPDLVSDGSEFTCNFCTSKLKLSVTKSSSSGNSKKLANQTNCFLPPPGGNCTFPPGAPPLPCAGVPPGSVISTGQSTVMIDGQTALGGGCQFLCPKGQPVSLSQAGQKVAKHDEASISAQVASLFADFIPGVGSAKSVYELIAGKDPITGEEVGRLSSMSGIVLGVVPGGKALIKGKKAAKVAKVAKKALKKGASKKVVQKTGKDLNLVYEAAPYHGKTNQGLKSRGPINGQAALDQSVQVKATGPRRIGIDKEAGEFVIFDNTGGKAFHGHVRTWNELRPEMQNALIKSNKVKVVNGVGKIIK